MDGRKPFSEPRRARTRSETTSVLLYYIQILKTIYIYIGFYILKTRKIIYTKPTLVLTRVCQAWAMHHANTPTTLSELSSLIQPRWSESIISSYVTSITNRPQGPVVLRNITSKIEIHDIVMIMYTHTYIIKHSHHVASLLNS